MTCGSLSRLLFHTDTCHPQKMHRNNFSRRIIHSSILTVPLSDSPTNGSERHFSACATTHIPQVQLDRVLFYEYDHRADELIGLKVDVSGEFNTDFELVFVQEALKTITSRLFSQSPPRNPLPRTRTGTFQCRTSTEFAPRPRHASRPPSRASLPPASTSCHFFSLAIPPRGFFAQSPRRQLKSTKTNTTILMFALKVTWL